MLGCVNDGLLAEIWSYLFRPPPAWSWSIEPEFDPDRAIFPVLERGFPRAAKTAFGFLEALGFVVTSADAWDLADHASTIAWERADALVHATLTDDGSFFVLIGPRPDDDDSTPTHTRLAALTDARGTVAAFGSLPVLGAGPEAVARAVGGYVDAFRDRVAALLADRPVDFEAVILASDAAVEELRRPRLIDYYQGRAEAAWNQRRYESFLESARQLEELGVGLDAKRVELAEARRRPPLTLGGRLDEAARIRAAADLVNEKQSLLNTAIAERHLGDDAWARWEDAAREWHEALALLYPEAFWDDLERLRTDDSIAADRVIAFLEVDPWCFRSGYAKETILHFLKRATLTGDQATRLRAVILNAVDVGDRREFRGHCKLARRVVDEGLRLALLERLRSSNPGQARRALWVLDALRDPLGPGDRAAAQGVLEHAAANAEWWRVSDWVRRLAGRYRDSEWIDRLLARATSGGHETGTALRLLSGVRLAPSAQQRRALASLVLREIQRGDVEDWLESTAVLADSPAFRDELMEAYDAASEPDIRRRAWWAINAIRRNATDGWPGVDFSR